MVLLTLTMTHKESKQAYNDVGIAWVHIGSSFQNFRSIEPKTQRRGKRLDRGEPARLAENTFVLIRYDLSSAHARDALRTSQAQGHAAL